MNEKLTDMEIEAGTCVLLGLAIGAAILAVMLRIAVRVLLWTA